MVRDGYVAQGSSGRRVMILPRPETSFFHINERAAVRVTASLQCAWVRNSQPNWATFVAACFLFLLLRKVFPSLLKLKHLQISRTPSKQVFRSSSDASWRGFFHYIAIAVSTCQNISTVRNDLAMNQRAYERVKVKAKSVLLPVTPRTNSHCMGTDLTFPFMGVNCIPVTFIWDFPLRTGRLTSSAKRQACAQFMIALIIKTLMLTSAVKSWCFISCCFLYFTVRNVEFLISFPNPL